MRCAALLPLLALLVGCRQDMHDQPRYEPLEASAFFKDGRSSRPQVEGTVARGQLRLDEHLYTGKIGGKPAVSFPFAITETVLERGRDRFNIFCSACHGKLGNGQGIVVQRGLKAPPSFHIDRLRQSPPGYYFDVMTNGFGAMFDLSHAVAVRDRWAIAAYVRVLQRSQRATLEDVPEPQRAALVEERERMKEGSK